MTARYTGLLGAGARRACRDPRRERRGRHRHPPDQQILAVKDAVLVGPIPADIQNYTVYAGSVAAGSKETDAAKAFIKILSGPEAAAALKTKGMEPGGK